MIRELPYQVRVLGAVKSFLYLAIAMIAFHPASADAQNCSMAVIPTAFGVYNAVTQQAVSTTASVTVTCTGFIVSVSYSISVSPGQSGSSAQRAMLSGANKLDYQVYIDAARTRIAGNGLGGTSVVSGRMSGLFTASRTDTLYSTIPAGQAAAPGAYRDTVTLQITY